MQDDFASLYAFNRWANVKMLDACRKLTPEQYAVELAAEQEKEDYRSRLALYEAGEQYEETPTHQKQPPREGPETTDNPRFD